MINTISFEIGGKELSIEVGRVAKQANGAVLLGMGETVVLGTATMSRDPREGLDFFPLTCDYEERKYAVGKIPGGFVKRGGRPSEKAILTSRLIDRPMRPLFPKGMRNDVQCIAMPFAVDQECPPDVLALNAVSAALTVSDIPWDGPVGAVRIGLDDNDDFILFPNVEQSEHGRLDLVVAGTKDAIIMVEAGASEVPEETILRAMKFAHEQIKLICSELEKLRDLCGKEKRSIPIFKVNPEILETIRTECGNEIRDSIVNPDKAARESALSDLLKEIVARYQEKYADNEEALRQLPEAADTVIKEKVRELIINDKKRPDGRGWKDIRQITVEPGLLPKVHGSGLFTRGQTQVMTVVTLGGPTEGQMIDGLEDVEDKRYMHFYNFPPYSVGEARPMRGPGRREIGHGALAERALRGVLPTKEEFPYAMLLVSEVLESNGSTSMASVCGSTVAMLDCGVPLKSPVAGIAMGLMTDEKTFAVLTDIQGMEDFSGDMDFKVAGTREGITALQLDTKIGGIPDEILASAIDQARDARLYILDKIAEAFPEARSELNPNAPRIETIQIDPARIGELIGPGGKTIKKIVADTGAQVDVEQDGKVYVLAADKSMMEAARKMITGMMISPEVGDEFTGPVTRIFGRGVMVEYAPGKEGMVTLEDLTVKKIRRPEEAVKSGDILNVRVKEIDSMGRINLTALGVKQDLPGLEENESATPAPSAPRDRGGFGRGGDRGRGNDRGRDRDRDRAGHRDRNDRRDREEHHRSEERSREDQPEFRPRQETGFPKKEAQEEGNVGARFRPKR
jgi:polyribonucleotide nucleotidyltransferase